MGTLTAPETARAPSGSAGLLRWRGLALGLLFVGAVAAGAQPITRLAAMGDSLTDEYAEETYDYARSWTELLVQERGISLGPTAAEAGQPGGTWGEPRRTGYEDNWARFGTTTDGAIADGQHTGVAQGVASRGVSHAVLFLGGNDFSPWAGAYDEIYDGTWGAAEIATWIDGRLANFRTLLDEVTATGVPVVLLNIFDFSAMPFLQQGSFPDPVLRDRVTAALFEIRVQAQDLARRERLVYLDIFGFGRAIFGTNTAPRGTLMVGAVEIDLTASDSPGGGDPGAAWVDDGVHPNTVIQGLWANAILSALNLAHGTAVPLFSEEEILTHAGLTYGGSDTLPTLVGDYHLYVTDFAGPFVFGDDFESGGTAAWSAVVP